MRGKKNTNSDQLPSLPVVAMATVLLVSLLVMIPPAMACPPSRVGCKSCIVNQMKNGCPSCLPTIRCMARCLWGGTPKPKCIKTCDCGQPRLSDCKRCMAPCRCSCVATA